MVVKNQRVIMSTSISPGNDEPIPSLTKGAVVRNGDSDEGDFTRSRIVRRLATSRAPGC